MAYFFKKWQRSRFVILVIILTFCFIYKFQKYVLFQSYHLNNKTFSISSVTIRSSLQNLLKKEFYYFPLSFNGEIKEETLLTLYEETKFQPLWFTSDRKCCCAHRLIKTLKQANDEGLEAKDYKPLLDLLEFFVTREIHSPKDQTSLKDLLRADILLSQAVLQYIGDVRGKRFFLKKNSNNIHLEKPYVDEVLILLSLIKNSPQDSCRWIKKLPPQHPQYQTLRNILKNLRKQKKKGKSEFTLSQGPLLEQGNKGERVVELRKALASRGYRLSSKILSNYFDKNLISTVKAYQKDQGVFESGKVTVSTLNLLSLNIQDKINQILVNMERWRWMPFLLEDKYLLVNIPEFMIYASEKGQVLFNIPISTGTSHNKTPLFYTQIISVIFNPVWNIPRNSATQIILKNVKKNGVNYFFKYKIHVYKKDGTEINPQSVNWNEITPENFNFYLKQDAGDLNFMGRICFKLDSPLHIYLHETPLKHFFKAKRRAFSSGCIHLEDPLKIAVFVFGDNSEWSTSHIKATIDSGEVPPIPLQNPVPIYVQYFTAISNKGRVLFLEDVYGFDKEMLDALTSRK